MRKKIFGLLEIGSDVESKDSSLDWYDWFMMLTIIASIIPLATHSHSRAFDAIYWATVSLTTMGYGDIYPVTTIGRIVTMISSIFGIAIIAFPCNLRNFQIINQYYQQM